MTTVAKGKNSSARFRKLMWKYSLRLSAHNNYYFFRNNVATRPINQGYRALNPSNMFVTTRKWVKMLLFPNICDKKMFVIKRFSWQIYFLCFIHMAHFSHKACRTTLKFEKEISLKVEFNFTKAD